MDVPKISVIISTYNQPNWLEKVLWSYELQTFRDFEIIIADDGSDHRTKAVISKFQSNSLIAIRHVWHEDEGFRKTIILNKALVQARSEYVIFTDGDCIARKDFVETHLKLRQPKAFLSGGYFKLSKGISDVITKSDIESQNCFNSKWLLERGQEKSFKLNKLTAMGLKAKLLNTLTPTKATFDGMNTSGWKQALLDVNGFDERMAYGGEDREIGERLVNLGIRFIQVRYSAICVHLFHERPYKNEASFALNKSIRAHTKKQNITYTNYGIKQ